MKSGLSLEASSDELFRQIHIDVTTSRRVTLGENGEPWEFSLISPFWRLYVNDTSGAAISYSGKNMELQPNRAYVIPAWVRFETSVISTVTQDYLHFYLIGFPSSLQRRIFDCPAMLPIDPLLCGLARRWRARLNEKPDLSGLEWARSLLHAALATLVARLPETSRALTYQWLAGMGNLRHALECIESRLANPPSNHELARLCHFSTDHFIRQFRRVIGMTPSRYGMERRIAVAAQWLAQSEDEFRIDEIAEATGFTDRFHFSRAFKAHFGIAPATYRRTHRASLLGGTPDQLKKA